MFPNENTVKISYVLEITNQENGKTSKIEEEHLMRYFFKPELEKYLNESGMELISISDGYSDSEPDLETWSATVIARKL